VEPASREDQAIADILARLGNQAADRAWLLADPRVDANGYDQPAARTARQLIERAGRGCLRQPARRPGG
jgi:hypothetical protein